MGEKKPPTPQESGPVEIALTSQIWAKNVKIIAQKPGYKMMPSYL